MQPHSCILVSAFAADCFAKATVCLFLATICFHHDLEVILTFEMERCGLGLAGVEVEMGVM